MLSGLSSWASLGCVIGFWLCIMGKLAHSGGSVDGTINMISSVVVVACKQIFIKSMNRTNVINTTKSLKVKQIQQTSKKNKTNKIKII